MRLLQTSTLTVVEKPPDKIPEYAILSHTWGSEEVLLADILNGTAEHKHGFSKIRYSCEQASREGLDYIWIDTCCIDKTNSVELSEAINSMYAWYQNAEICYAYLADVSGDDEIRERDSQFAHSRWFKRGWTLQELLAPRKVNFYSKEWTEIGERSTLCDILEEITMIPNDFLRGLISLQMASIAMRMSWAACRETTRPEDTACCLMGLFSVNMPMLYGEGSRAFLRLQEEIMKNSNDHSLFVWTDPDASPDSYYGLLAESPKLFGHHRGVTSFQDRHIRSPFSMGNTGLQIEMHLTRLHGNTFAAALDCPSLDPERSNWFLALYLQKLSTGGGAGQYARVAVNNLHVCEIRGKVKTIYVRQRTVHAYGQNEIASHVFQIRTLENQRSYEDAQVFYPPGSAPPPTAMPFFRPPREIFPKTLPSTFLANLTKVGNQAIGAILLTKNTGRKILIILGYGWGQSLEQPTLAYRALAVQITPGWDDIDEIFQPKPMGSTYIVDNDQITVRAEPVLYSGSRYYIIDIEVEDIASSTWVKRLDRLEYEPGFIVCPFCDEDGMTKVVDRKYPARGVFATILNRVFSLRILLASAWFIGNGKREDGRPNCDHLCHQCGKKVASFPEDMDQQTRESIDRAIKRQR